MEAITREEIFLAKIIGETVPDIEPSVRKEMFLARIAGMDIPAIEPITREEMFLNAIANGETVSINPITRRELYYAKALGMDVVAPEPITREEVLLSQLSQSAPSEPVEKYSWEGVFASIDKGTYATDYAIGDMIPLDLGSEGLINMQIAAFDKDDLADGSGKAPITWIAKELLKTFHMWNPALVTNDDGTYQEGTGAVGGWEKCEMRTYLKETIKPLIPENVRNAIKEVTKTQSTYDTSGKKFTQTTTENVWIPSITTEFNSMSLFDDVSSRAKARVGATMKVAYATRAVWDIEQIMQVNSNGGAGGSGSNNCGNICLCFCT